MYYQSLTSAPGPLPPASGRVLSMLLEQKNYSTDMQKIVFQQDRH
jgi:hypothetical protein